MVLLFKICSGAEWTAATAASAYRGSVVDAADGFIHLSAAHQVKETAARHFARREDLVLVAIEATRLHGLVWEPSRGGDLFPHLYGPLPLDAVSWVKPLPWRGDTHVFPGLDQ